MKGTIFMSWEFDASWRDEHTEFKTQKVSDTDPRYQQVPIPVQETVIDKIAKLLDIPNDPELVTTWVNFLKNQDANYFYRQMYTKCNCQKPAVVHGDPVCPVCGALNPNYLGYVAVDKLSNTFVTAQDIILFQIETKDLEFLNDTDESLNSKHRMFESMKDKIDTSKPVKIELKNNSY